MSLDVAAYFTQWYSVLVGALIVYTASIYIKKQRFIRKHGCKEPRKQRSAFFALDLIYQLLNAKRDGRLVDFCNEVLTNIGETFYVRLLGIRIVFTIEPENMKAILATQFNDFALGKRHTFFKPLLGDGIFTLDGSGWKHSRAMLRPQFARDQVAHVKALEPHIQILAKHIKNANGKTFDLQELFFNFTVDTASEFLFGESFNALHTPEVSDKKQISVGNVSFAESFNKAQVYLATRSYLQDFYWLVSPKDFHDACGNVHQYARYYVNKALSFTPEELEEKSQDGYVFLYELVKQTRDPVVLQDQLLNILVAGRDTTAGLLSFIFFELARNPEIFEKLKDEIYSNFGSGDDSDVEAITFESLKKCEYLKFVINEALRLYPSVPINFRVATKETTLPRGGGEDGQSPVYIAKGTTVGYSVYATHRLEQYYGKDAEEFRPERWANLNKLGWAYLPFNGGPRICLGQQFALTEASYVITRIIQLFPNISTKDREYPPKKCVHLTMSHHTGVFVEMT